MNTHVAARSTKRKPNEFAIKIYLKKGANDYEIINLTDIEEYTPATHNLQFTVPQISHAYCCGLGFDQVGNPRQTG